MPAVSELRQCGSIQLGQVGSSSATARSYSTVIASSRPAALSGSTSTAGHTSASRVAPNIWALLLTSWAILAAWPRSSSRSPAGCQRLQPLGRVAQERTGELDDEGVVLQGLPHPVDHRPVKAGSAGPRAIGADRFGWLTRCGPAC